MHTHTYVCACAYLCIHANTHMCVFVYTHTYTHAHTCTYAHKLINLSQTTASQGRRKQCPPTHIQKVLCATHVTHKRIRV